MPDLTTTELHVLLALGSGASYGYRLQQQVETESGGTLTPDIGALYRTLARLMERGWVEEVDTPPREEEASSPGRPRRWYGLSALGRGVLAEEVGRLASVVRLARERDVAPGSTG
jgi:DNA-binding PadR family transcriptional regulator